MANERLSAERLAEMREWATYNTVPASFLKELLAELDAVTRERDEALARLEKFGFKEDVEEIRREAAPRSVSVRLLLDELDAVTREKDDLKILLEQAEKKLGIGLSGMNFITNRERGAK